MISISKGNKKLGNIPSFSLPPIITCNPRAVNGAGECGEFCYAKKLYKRFPNVKKAYDNNLTAWNENPADVVNEIQKFLEQHRPPLFRWFVSGDIPDHLFLTVIIAFAKKFPNTKFLLYTKRDIMINSAYPYLEPLKNLSVILSAGKSWRPQNPYGLPVSYVDEHGENFYRGYKCDCKTSCKTCKKCFNFPSNIVFPIH